ncbi:MAG: hypothetical protein ACR2FH_06880 [Caulobacteraceae bacterium]
MIVFELPASRDGGDVRAVALGSCRIRNPISVLRDRGQLRIRAEGPTPTHTAAEALQSLDVAMGRRSLPDPLHPFVFETDPGASTERLGRELRQGIDVFVLEISDDKQFSHGEFRLNQNFVSRKLVQAHRGALLDWYREVCRGRPDEETSVQTALGKLRDAGFAPDEAMADLLRGIRLDRDDGAAIAETLVALRRSVGGRWVVVGPFTTPGDEGDIMRRRRAFNLALEEAATAHGAVFYDPSRLIAEHGKATALAGGGVDIYEYEESFYPTVGETLVALVRAVQPPRRPAVAAPHVLLPAAVIHDVVRQGWAMRLEAGWNRLAKRVRRLGRRLRRGGAKLLS